MLLSGFSFAQYSNAWLFTVNLSYFSISYKVLPLLDTWSLTDAENYLNMVHIYCVKTENTK